MIKTTRQLKDKIRNLSGGNSKKAQALLRNYIMERFLERVSVSEYNNRFVLKGGMLVSSLVGIDTRATMDIDSTIRSYPLNLQDATKMINDIIAIQLPDNVNFQITGATDIMEEHEYSGLRFMLNATFENLKQVIKIDISTGDVITPAAIVYSYKLMFEERSISIYTYNIETLLAEKLETVMARGVTNTRMRDFYDIYEIFTQHRGEINREHLNEAFSATCRKRDTMRFFPEIAEILNRLRNNEEMILNWNRYKTDSFYVDDLSWDDVMERVSEMFSLISSDRLLTV